MEKVKHLVFQHQDKLKHALILGAGIGALNCLARADYNIVLYLYIYYIWNFIDSKETQTTEKISSLMMLSYSLLIDVIWVFFWGSVWGSLKNDFEASIHTIVQIFSWLGILLKAALILAIGIIEWNNVRSSLPKQLQEKLNLGSNYAEQKDEPSHA